MQQPELMASQGWGERGSFEASVLHGMRRFARVSESSRLRERLFRRASESVAGGMSARSAFGSLEESVQSGRFRYHAFVGAEREGDVPGYGYTANNRREFDFLDSLFGEVGVSLRTVNLCDLPPRKAKGRSSEICESVLGVSRDFLDERGGASSALLHQLTIYIRSVLGAYEALAGSKGRIFAVANDHSPAPVAYASVARALGMRVIYAQHAEVTRRFPPLEFDLSLLRNQVSAHTYGAIGGMTGEVVVAARHGRWRLIEEIREAQAQLAGSPSVHVVLYPSGVVDSGHLRQLADTLTSNDAVTAVSVKQHPNAREELPPLPGAVSVVSEIPAEPHVAICGNSAVVVELLGAGCLVFQDFELDDVESDYYGFVSKGMARRMTLPDARKSFWTRGFQSTQDLADYIPRLVTDQNLIAACDVRPGVLDAIEADPVLREAARAEAEFLRGLVRDVPKTLESVRSQTAQGLASWVLEALDRLERGRVIPVSSLPLEAYQVDQCASLVDLWWIAQRRLVTAIGPDEVVRGRIQSFVRGLPASQREAQQVTRWVDLALTADSG